MKVDVVLISPEYDGNVGAVCRVMKNFGFKNLIIINPKCKLGFEARLYAKHAYDVLKNAKRMDSIEELKGRYDVIIGTTAERYRHKNTVRSVIWLKEFIKNSKYYEGKKIALLFGREGIGLNEKEINFCDILITIESSKEYPSLNLSHAVGIILYEISNRKERKIKEKMPPREKVEALLKNFEKLASRFKTRNKRGPIAFKRLIFRGRITDKETNAILNIIRLANDALDKSGSACRTAGHKK